jgi:hypothetical protein
MKQSNQYTGYLRILFRRKTTVPFEQELTDFSSTSLNTSSNSSPLIDESSDKEYKPQKKTLRSCPCPDMWPFNIFWQTRAKANHLEVSDLDTAPLTDSRAIGKHTKHVVMQEKNTNNKQTSCILL